MCPTIKFLKCFQHVFVLCVVQVSPRCSGEVRALRSARGNPRTRLPAPFSQTSREGALFLSQSFLFLPLILLPPPQPFDEDYLNHLDPPVKHMSFHAYIRKLTGGADK